MTLLGTDGWAVASLYTVERRCEYLCSLDGGEECHWTALYAPGPAYDAIGTPVAALPGGLSLQAYSPLDASNSVSDPMARLEARGDFVPLLWDRDPSYRPTYRIDAWDPGEGLLGLTIRQPAGDESAIDTGECASRAREGLLTIDCSGLSLLASGGVPLLLSWPDYNSAKAETLARFDYGGSRHYVVRIGAKAQDVVGLVSGEPAGWRARFRLRDWASIC